MRIQFILAQPEEAEALSELRHRVWQSTYRGIYPDEMIDNFDYTFHNERNRMLIQSSKFMVYFITAGDDRVGYLILQKRQPLHLQSLYLLPEYRGLGIGTRAFDFVRSYCQANNLTKFDLDCHPDNKAAQAFYAKMGGVVVRQDLGHERNEENGVTLEFIP